jgi:hypothetical protein
MEHIQTMEVSVTALEMYAATSERKISVRNQPRDIASVALCC